MPLDRQAAFQLGVLLLALPAQILISSYFSTGDETQRTNALNKIISNAAVLKNKIFSWENWEQWCRDLIQKVKTLRPGMVGEASDAEEDMGESPALEVLNLRDPKGFFAGSMEPRSPRPGHVKYRIGQVIRHKRWGYRGIIVGWDPETRAPESWLKQMHPADKPHWRKLPSYSVLVDTRDRPEAQTTYVVEENIEIVSAIKVLHPDTDQYFEGYDGAQYLPRPWLKKIYPHD